MNIIKFDEQNITWRGDGKLIGDLPAYMNEELTLSCWEISEEELKVLIKTRKLWMFQWNHGKPLQPQSVAVENPFQPKDDELYEPEQNRFTSQGQP